MEQLWGVHFVADFGIWGMNFVDASQSLELHRLSCTPALNTFFNVSMLYIGMSPQQKITCFVAT
jgi:hypothetical protein